MSELVSIVVPIYKVEEYLNRCIDSIIRQTYNNLEIILVDDGSPDNCGMVCEEYAVMDSRIKVIHKENGGLSDARNYGIKVATGEYILFVDSDDYIDKNAVENLLGYMRKYDLDIICGNAWKVVGDKKTKLTNIRLPENIIMTGEEYMATRLSNGHFSAAVWNNMYKTELIKDNNIYFVKGLLHEDENWTPKILLYANKVMYVDFCFYNYIIRENSITQKPNKEQHVKDIMKTCFELENIYNNSKISEANKKLFSDYLARLYMSTAILGAFNRKLYATNVDKSFVKRNSYFMKTRVKSFIFCLNVPLYRLIKGSI